MQDDAFGLGFLDFFERRRHLVRRFSRQTMSTSRAPRRRAESEMSTISCVATAATFSCRGLCVFHSRDVLLQHFARGRTRHVHGHIAAADHDHFLADGEPVAQVGVEQEIDALVHAVQIDARNRKVAAAVRAHGDHHRIEALARANPRS